MLSYVSKAESTPEIAEVGPASLETLPWSLTAPHSGWGWGLGPELPGEAGVLQASHAHGLPLQQRGERDSQTQGILTKLKCAAGEASQPEASAVLQGTVQCVSQIHTQKVTPASM